MRKRHISMVRKVDQYNFVDVSNTYGLELQYGDILSLTSTEDIFSSVSSVFQTDNYFSVVLKHKGDTFHVSISKFNTFKQSELVLLHSLSSKEIRFRIENIPYI